MGSCHETNFRPSRTQHAISFQSGAINTSSTNMIPMANFYGVGNNNTCMVYPGNSNIMSNSLIIPRPGSSLLDKSVPSLTNETGFSVEWSTEEQFQLEEGLKKYEDESSIMKYVKIASMLPDKTVHDVALRCSWMTDKLVESSSKTNLSLASTSNLAPYSLFMNPLDHTLSGPTRQLLEQNNQVLDQIEANLSILKLQENVNLFLHTRNNLAVILDNMRGMPGIMSKMPPLPVTINEGLINNLLPYKSQVMLLGSSSGIYLKQEPD